ncbi:MAG: hypothetical protein GW757_08430 [Alphaproteobacteria bacterium]|nr:hypothetical protein [Alphaproteobacteria bacterium]
MEEGQSHEWVKLFADDEGTLWIDSSWKSSRNVDGVDLPLVLMRTELLLPDEAPFVADLAMAVDCADKRMGIAGAWAEAPDAMVDGAEWMDDIRMDFAQKPLDDQDVLIFNFVCGSD